MYTCMRRLSVHDISCLPLRWIVVYKLWHCIYSIRSDLIRFDIFRITFTHWINWMQYTIDIDDDDDDREWILILSFYYETFTQ